MKEPTEAEAQARKREFERGMGLLAGAFRVAVTKEVMAAYWHVLGRYDSERLRKGFDRALNNETFFPPPAKVKEYIPVAATDIYPVLT